ncbi:MAG TPA: hypothetical protein EYQ74_08510 [Planctomycetes bacterium]|nr:hypothetical protein [Planctomycetota bacterium]HIK60113.1 hypothetical protein [Planctomycetota bacterium]
MVRNRGEALESGCQGHIAVQAGAYFGALPESVRGRLSSLLLDDLLTEYDARLLGSHLRRVGAHWSEAFWRVEADWEADESQHHRVARRVYLSCGGSEDLGLGVRQADFSHLEPWLDDEFAFLCLAAYDEWVTVRAYSAGLAWYDALGPAFGRWMRGVIADEARHYCQFLSLAKSGHPERLQEVPDLMGAIGGVEGEPYRSTFLLDHDDPIFRAEWFDQARRVLQRHLRAGLPDGATRPHSN